VERGNFGRTLLVSLSFYLVATSANILSFSEAKSAVRSNAFDSRRIKRASRKEFAASAVLLLPSEPPVA
jgi:hypothetical protein